LQTTLVYNIESLHRMNGIASVNLTPVLTKSKGGLHCLDKQQSLWGSLCSCTEGFRSVLGREISYPDWDCVVFPSPLKWMLDQYLQITFTSFPLHNHRPADYFMLQNLGSW